MNVVLSGLRGGWGIVVVAAFVMLLLGFKMVPELARGFELGFREFKKACLDLANEIQKNL